MPTWIYFVLAAQLIWAFCALIDKFIILKGYIKNPLVYIVLNGLMNIFLIFLLPFVGFEQLRFADFLIALSAGALWATAVAIYYKAVQYDEISKVVILSQLVPIFVLVLSFLFLEEKLTKSHLAGFFFLISAGVIVSYKNSQKSFKLGRAFYLMLASALLGAFSVVAAKYIYTITGFWSAFLWLRLTSFAALGSLFAPSVRKEFIDTFRGMKKNIKGLLTFKMVIDFSAFIFAGYALANGPISLVTALGSSALPLFVFLFAYITSVYFPNIIKEELSKESFLAKGIALIFIAIGIVFVNM